MIISISATSVTPRPPPPLLLSHLSWRNSPSSGPSTDVFYQKTCLPRSAGILHSRKFRVVNACGNVSHHTCCLDNHTRVQTHGLSQGSSALLPTLCCVLSLKQKLNPRTLSSLVPPPPAVQRFRNSNFGAKNFFRKKAHTLRVTKGRGGGLVRYLGSWATFRRVCHGKKINVPFGQTPGKIVVKACPFREIPVQRKVRGQAGGGVCVALFS